MKIGFLIKWPRGSIKSKGNVIGEELYANAMCRILKRMTDIESCDLYAPNHMPGEPLDLMIHLNDTSPDPEMARKHIQYLQTSYLEGADKALEKFYERGFHGFAFVSKKLFQIHAEKGRPGIYLPLAADTEIFYPREINRKYAWDVSYIGNDIKGEERTLLYIYPGVNHSFGLYGNWKLPFKLKYWKYREYQRKFSKITKGKIPQEDVPVLFSSSKINLNCTTQDYVNWDTISLRSFEILACRGFLISDRVSIAEKDLEGCAVFTDGGKDLEEKLEYYLARPDERGKIAQKGYQYVMENETIESRSGILLGYIRDII
jgi:spore maturation protein CgeB